MLTLLLFTLAAEAKSVAKKAPPPPAPVVEAPAPVAPPVDALATMPVVGPEVAFTVPVPEVATLSNGASVWVIAAPSLPLVTLTLTVPGGSAWDKPGKEGAAALADRLLTQGAGNRNAEQFAAEVERLGIQLDVSTGRAMSMITMSMKRDTLEPALDLLEDMLLRPATTEEDFRRERDSRRSPTCARRRTSRSPSRPTSRGRRGSGPPSVRAATGRHRARHAARLAGGHPCLPDDGLERGRRGVHHRRGHHDGRRGRSARATPRRAVGRLVGRGRAASRRRPRPRAPASCSLTSRAARRPCSISSFRDSPSAVRASRRCVRGASRSAARSPRASTG